MPGSEMGATERRLQDFAAGCPFYREEQAQFTLRSEGLSLGNIPNISPPSTRFIKDYDRSLITHDIPRARPLLAHPVAGSGMPLPWKCLEKPDMEEIPKSRTRTHYPPVHPNRPRDMSLTAADIEEALPRKIGRNSEGHARSHWPVDPLSPKYQFLTSEAPPPPPVQESTKRCNLDISDIEKTSSTPRVPVREQYGDPLKCEPEFRSRGGRGMAQRTRLRDGDLEVPQRACLTPRREGPQLSGRSVDPLHPQYRVPLTRDAGTSLHCRWSEERRSAGDAPPQVDYHDVGLIHGSAPQPHVHDNGEPFRSLEVRDVPGATGIPKVGGIPFSMYGPAGNRPLSMSLNSQDIEGAQAGTRPCGPRVRARTSRLAGAAIVADAHTPRGDLAHASTFRPSLDGAETARLQETAASAQTFQHSMDETMMLGKNGRPE